MTPLVSVLMPVRNGMPWLEDALCSLRGQTLKNIEILVLEDGSTDESPRLLAGWPDPRVRIIPTGGIGIGGALNVGLREARAPYVARQDADDVSLASRLERQVDLLQRHAHVDLVGCTAEYIDALGRSIDNPWVQTIRRQQDVAVTPQQIRDLMPLTCCLTHGSIVVRTDLLRRAGGYNPTASPAEDYDLWLRLLPDARFAKLPERLYLYRVHENQATTVARPNQIRTTITAKLRYLRRLCPGLPSPARLALVGNPRGDASYQEFAEACGFVTMPALPALEQRNLPFLARQLLRRRAFEGWDVLAVTDFDALEAYSAMAASAGLTRVGNFFINHQRASAEAA